MAKIETKSNPSRNNVWQMFDRIAHRYDLLNRMLSFGQDVLWRKKLAGMIPRRPDLKILDLATGTADLLLSICTKHPDFQRGVGLDMAQKMLHFGRIKINQGNYAGRLVLLPGDAGKIPFRENSFNALTISFGIRNVLDVNESLREMHRVCEPGGAVFILEFSLPKSRLFKQMYLFYFRYILPKVGGWISGDSYAYQYLNRTVETFPYGTEFCKLMTEAGFRDVRAKTLTFGIATIYSGQK